jgi:hypothetical protein
MPDFPIDPELRIRARPPIVLRRTTEAVDFIRKAADDVIGMRAHGHGEAGEIDHCRAGDIARRAAR